MLNKRILVLMFVVAFLLLVGCGPPTIVPNRVPIITSDPIITATVGVEYTYDVNATDPDGDTLTYSLATPVGMTINSASGLIMWIPTSAQVGNNLVTVMVSDGTLYITQSFTIVASEPTAPPVNQAPVIISTPITTATVGITYFYDVNATDPNSDILTYSLTACPGGMVISSANGLIMWTPTVKGNYAVVVNVSDGALSDTQGFTIVVSKPTVPVETYTITSSAGTGGSISPLGDVTVIKGKNIVFTIIPNANYNIDDVLVDGGSVGAVAFYNFTNVAKDHTIHATFSAISEPPTVNQAPTITSEPITTAILGVEYIYDVDATDPDGDVLTYSILTTKPDGMAIDPGTGVISWISNAKGDYAIVVEVNDGELSDTQSFAIKVSAVEITGIEVIPDEMTLVVGESKDIESVTATYKIKTGLEADIPLETCTYTSDPSGVVTVDAGVVTAEGEGGTTITVAYAGKEDEIVVTVFQPLSLPVHNFTQNNYYATIQDAIDNGLTLAGDIIEVAAGTYNETVTIGKNSLTIIGDSSSRPAITGGLKFDTDLSGLTLENFYVTGMGGSDSIVRMYDAITDLTIDNCVFDGENITDRMGFTGGQLEGNVTITNSEFKDILGWAVLDSRSGSGVDGSAMVTVTFTNNHIHDCDGSVVFRGLSTDWTDNVYIYGNTFTNIGDAGVSEHWAAFEVNRANNVEIYNNEIRNVVEGLYGEGQAMQLWQVGTVDIHNNTIEDNYQGIVFLDWPGGEAYDVSGVSIYHNSFSGNNQYALRVEDGLTGLPLNAENNWWGSEFGPKFQGSPWNGGDTVSDNVNYEHWLPSPH